MTDTITKLRGILEEMFSPLALAALKDLDKPWWEPLGAKHLDRVDFELSVADETGIRPPKLFMDTSSLKELAAFIDMATPNTRNT